jgi:uncharacterized protein involved in type VI secretion and phage assembly
MGNISKFNSLYVGTCVDNNDPTKLGKIKVTIPNIYGNIQTEALPWAEPCFPYGSIDRGIFCVPEINALVTVMFIDGSYYKPVWMGVVFRAKKHVIPQEAKDNYPDVREIKTKTGYIKFDDKDEILEIKHRSGSCIRFEENGDIIIHAANNGTIMTDSKLYLNPTSKTSAEPIKEYSGN